MTDAPDLSPADETRPLLHFSGRRWSRARLLAEAGGLVQLLRARGLPPGATLGIALPNLPGAVIALLAALTGGWRAAPVDPRQPLDALLDWQARVRPQALVTLDLATVFERTRPLFEDPGLSLILLARMADELSSLPRLLSPWLRAGGTVRPPEDPRVAVWPRRPGPLETKITGSLLLPDGSGALPDGRETLEGKALLALPLAHPAALGALFAAWRGGGELLLSPRLDERGLAKAAKIGGVQRRIEG